MVVDDTSLLLRLLPKRTRLITHFNLLEDRMNPSSNPLKPQLASLLAPLETMTDALDYDYLPLPAGSFSLSPDQVSGAMAASQPIADSRKRWAVYLGHLALTGFEQWLGQQLENHIQLDRSQAQIPEPEGHGRITIVKNLLANGFRLCLIVVPGQPDEMIDIPPLAIESELEAELESELADFYIPVTLYEDLHQVRIGEFLTKEALVKHRQASPLSLNRDGTYAVPLDWFSSDCDRLLLILNTLQPAPSSPVPKPDPQPVFNLARWFKREVNDLIEDLTWTLIPSWQIASAMRGDTISMRPMDANLRNLEDTESFLPIFKSLTQQGIHLYANSRAAYQNIQIGDHVLQLCVLAAPLPHSTPAEANSAPEWSLMAILKPQHERYLPDQIYLRIADAGSMLVEQGTQASKPGGSLFVRATGEANEQLTVTISQPQDGTSQMVQLIFTLDEA
jgi:hypothetical protein